MAKKTQDSPEAAKKEEGLDKKSRHHGEFVTFRGAKMPAYAEFQDVEGIGRGFAIFCAETGKELRPGFRFLQEQQIKQEKIKFAFNGKKEPVN